MNTMTLWDLTGWEFAALAFAALLVGFSKTAVSGANTVSLAVFAAVLPARASTGVLLPILIAGDVLAVEPMACAGRGATRVLEDGWTVVTVDGSWAAHWEHTVAVTGDGPEVLTRP